MSWIPTYTRHSRERVERLQLSVKEAQFTSQLDGARSVAQIARNLRLDLKFARLIVFRLVELEVVECWPPADSDKTERGGVSRQKSRPATEGRSLFDDICRPFKTL